MFTVNYGITGWYGSVSFEDPLDAEEKIARLVDIVRAAREAYPKASKATSEPATPAPTEALNDTGRACLAFCVANPRCTHEEYTKAGHTLRTIKWLRSNGYLQSVDGVWIADYTGSLVKKA